MLTFGGLLVRRTCGVVVRTPITCVNIPYKGTAGWEILLGMGEPS